MDELRTILEATIGEVLSLDKEAPGVWFLASRKTEKSFTTEYYLVEQRSETISDQAKTYGVPVEGHPALLLFAVNEADSGYQIVRYEIAMHQHRVAPTPETLAEVRTSAIYGTEYHPEYFGEYPAPLDTPRGRTLRSRKLWNGVWCLETDSGERMVAFCYPFWEGDLSPEAEAYGEKTREDLARGINNICGYLFFPWEASCIPLYEWLVLHPECKAHEMLDYDALKNVLCNKYTDYALQVNQRALEEKQFDAQRGMDTTGMPDKLLTCVPGAGFDFLKF